MKEDFIFHFYLFLFFFPGVLTHLPYHEQIVTLGKIFLVE